MNFDYHRINRRLLPKYVKELQSALQIQKENGLTKYKQEVESKFAKYIQTNHSYLVESGTTAIQLALQLAGIKGEDEVILPCANYPSAVLSILYLKAKPVFVDIKENATIDENKIEEKITEKTKAILPVHLFGHACNMQKIMEIAEQHNLKVVEDACQAHGSTLNNKKLGSIGHINAFSFTYHKTLGTIGGGGAINFNDNTLKKELDNFLIVEKDHENLIASGRAPGKMSMGDQVLLKLKILLADFLKKDKQKNQDQYLSQLQDIQEIKSFTEKGSVRQSFFILAEKRDQLKQFLERKGIASQLPYKTGLDMSIYSPYITSDFPMTQQYQQKGLILPLFPLMKTEEITQITNTIKEFYPKTT